MIDKHAMILVITISAVTILLRFIPFVVFRSNKETPKFISYLGKVLPYAIMGVLVVFALKDTVVAAYPYGLPELIACAIVVLLHLWKRNSLISIICGTASYMILVQLVFK